MNKPLSQIFSEADVQRWKEVKDREIWKQKIEKIKTREVKLKLKLFYDNLNIRTINIK